MGGIINLTGVPDFNQWEIVKEGSSTVTLTAGATGAQTIPHNLGFVPFVMAAMDNVGVGSLFSNGDIMLPTWTNVSLDTVNHVLKFGAWLEAASDMTNLYLLYNSALAANSGPYTVKYYLIRKRSR